MTAIVSPAAHEPESARSRRLRRRSAALSDGEAGTEKTEKIRPVTTDGATDSATPGRRQRLGRKFPRVEEDAEERGGGDDDDDETAGEKKAAGPGPGPGSESAYMSAQSSRSERALASPALAL